MSYTYLLEQGVESSAACFSDIPACVLSRLNLTVEKSCCNGNGMGSCRSSRSGMMSEPSTESRGAVESILYAAGSLARTSARPEKGRESTANNQDCGPRWQGSFAKWNPHSCSWRTAQCSLFGGLVEFSETWPRWGMMRDGECSVLPMPSGLAALRASITCGNESGSSLPTPTVTDSKERTYTYDSGDKTKLRLALCGVVRLPTLHGFSKDGASNGPSGNELGRAVNRMETPTKQDGVDRTPSKNFRLTKTGRARHLNAQGIESQERLAQQVKRLPTVTTMDQIERKAMRPSRAATGRRTGYLSESVAGGSLNPPWVEWLMGWPKSGGPPCNPWQRTSSRSG